jgi:D-alanine-D-alanine ligase-like ATP-grasp enzyme
MLRNSIAPQVDPELVRDYISRWPNDRNAGCLEYAVVQRGVQYQRVEIALDGKQKPQEMLHISIGRQEYLYMKGKLDIKRKGLIRSAYKHINGNVPIFTSNKEAVKQLLSQQGYSSPAGKLFLQHQYEEALAYFRQIGKTVCIKPNNGYGGKDVFTAIQNEETFKWAFEFVARSSSQVLVEEHIEGDTMRFFYLKPKVVGIRVDQPVYVVGNGTHNIEALIELKNQQRAERQLPGHGQISINEDLIRYIRQQQLDLEGIPATGQRVDLQSGSNSGRGGECRTCAETVHPSHLELVEEICATMPELKMGAIDVIVRDYQAPVEPDNYKVLEINSTPGVLPFYFPWQGSSQDIYSVLIDRLIKRDWY